MIEAEFKCLVNKSIYDKILNTIMHNDSYDNTKTLQINYYYDTENFDLYKKNITCRVRQKESNLKLQFKTSIYNEDVLRVKNESSFFINELPSSIILDNFFSVINFEINSNANMYGQLVTERNTCVISNKLKIDLDKNIYLGVVDYELEIELLDDNKSEASKLLKEIMGDYPIELKGGKNSRLFMRLNELNNIDKLTIMEEIK